MTLGMSRDEISSVASLTSRLDGKLELLSDIMVDCNEKLDVISGDVKAINQRCTDRESFCSYKMANLASIAEKNVARIDELKTNGHSIKTSWNTVRIIAISIGGMLTFAIGAMTFLKHLR